MYQLACTSSTMMALESKLLWLTKGPHQLGQGRMVLGWVCRNHTESGCTKHYKAMQYHACEPHMPGIVAVPSADGEVCWPACPA